MRRILAAAASVAAVLSIGAGQAFAGNHNGPEAPAKGTGEVTVRTTVNTPIIGTICIGGFICSTGVVGSSVAVTTAAQSFDFDAKAGPHEVTPLDATDGPQGTMRLTVESTTTTTVSRNPVCNDPFYTVFGCPVPSSTTTPTQTSTTTAEVTCLNVVNNMAAIGGHVIRYSGPGVPQRGLVFSVTDNTVAGLQPAPDQFSGAPAPEAPQECLPPTSGSPISGGDIYVDQS